MFLRKKIDTIEFVVNFEFKHPVDWLRATKLSPNESKSNFVLFRYNKSQVNTCFKLRPVIFIIYLRTRMYETLS